MVIGITGKKQAGKDTLYQVFKTLRPHAERRAFADKLKESAAALLEISVKDLDDWKTDKNMIIEGGHFNIFKHPRVCKLTFREFLQRYGTEAHREVFGDDFWLEQCLPTSERKWLSDSDSLIIVTDVRFDNEAEWILDMGGLIFQIERGTVDDTDNHPSETPINPDLVHQVIRNDGSIEDLTEKVKELCKLYGIRIQCGC